MTFVALLLSLMVSVLGSPPLVAFLYVKATSVLRTLAFTLEAVETAVERKKHNEHHDQDGHERFHQCFRFL